MNTNIPQGRGMIKWAPFATMPEQFENVGKLIEQQAHVAKPSLDVDLLQELELQLRNHVNETVVLRHWESGYEIHTLCKVEYIDDWSRTIIVSKGDRVFSILFDDIYEIKMSKADKLYNID